MNRTLTMMITFILLSQIASYSFNEIPPQIEWEEPMQGDPDWKVTGRNNNTTGNNTGGNNTGGNNTGGNNTGGNNTTSQCGNDTNLTSLYAWSSYSTYVVSDTLLLNWYVNCTVVGENYTLETWLTNTDTGSTFWGSSNYYSWTATYTSMSLNDYVWNQTVGYHCLNATLYDGSGSYIAYSYDCFSVTSNNTQNVTGNISVSTNGNQFYHGDTIVVDIESYNLVSGNEYQVYWYVTGTSQSGSYSWVGSSTPNVNQQSFTAGNNSTYCIQAYLYHIVGTTSSTYLDYDTTCVNVGNVSSNNTGGNNTGGNNTSGNNTGGNNTGGNNTGGNNTTGNVTWGNISVSPSSFSYHQGDVLHFTIESYNLELGVDYEVDWEVYNSGQTSEYGVYSWMATSSMHQQYQSVFLNTTGTYCITGWLYYSDSSGVLHYLTMDENCVQVTMNYTDMDNDGINDSIDNCLNMTNSNQSDMDNDGIGDACDTDIDGDGVPNDLDAFPYDPTENRDFDGDGIGDNADPDDDNDGMSDVVDVFPFDSSEQIDTDGDGIGNNADTDDDGDGITDILDNCPLTSNPDQQDLDGDGIGSACDGIEDTVPSVSDENETDDTPAIPALGAVGTLLAVTIGFIAVLRREEE